MNLDWAQISAMVALTLSSQAMAWEPLTLRELYITHHTFREGSRNFDYDNAKLENREIGQELTLTFNVDFFDYFFWDNDVISYVDRHKDTQKPSQFRGVQWKFFAGVRPTEFLSFGYAHHSRHMLDSMYVKEINNGRFPVEDSFFVRVYLHGGSKL